MELRYRIVSLFLFAIVIAVISVSDQIGALLPATWAILFSIVVLALREIVKAYGNLQIGITMDLKYRVLSGVLIAVALGIIALETTLTSAFPQYATAISIGIIIIREMVKDKGLTKAEETPKEEEKVVEEVDTITPEKPAEEIDEV